MSRPRDSSPRSYELIFNALIDGPRCYSEIIEETSLHRNTVSSRLKYLVEEGLLRKYKDGRRMIYEIIYDKKENFAWVKPWSVLMTTKDDKVIPGWVPKYLTMITDINTDRFVELANKIVKKTRLDAHKKKLKMKESQEFIQKANEKNIPITLEHVLYNLNNPFCPECLDKYGKLVESRYDEILNECACLDCGLVIEYII